MVLHLLKSMETEKKKYLSLYQIKVKKTKTDKKEHLNNKDIYCKGLISNSGVHESLQAWDKYIFC